MDTRTLNLSFEKDGKRLTMGDTSPYQILDIKGLEASEYELSVSPNANLAGSTLTGARVSVRPLEITFEIPNNEEFAVYRQSVIRLFHPLQEAMLTVDYNGTKRCIPYRTEHFEFENSNLYERLRGIVALICPQPFFMSLDSYGKNIAAKTPMLAFPLISRRGRGNAMSYKTFKAKCIYTQ